MTAKNDITGDLIQTKAINSQQFRDNFDAIFRKPKEEVKKEKPQDSVQKPADTV